MHPSAYLSDPLHFMVTSMGTADEDGKAGLATGGKLTPETDFPSISSERHEARFFTWEGLWATL